MAARTQVDETGSYCGSSCVRVEPKPEPHGRKLPKQFGFIEVQVSAHMLSLGQTGDASERSLHLWRTGKGVASQQVLSIGMHRSIRFLSWTLELQKGSLGFTELQSLDWCQTIRGVLIEGY